MDFVPEKDFHQTLKGAFDFIQKPPDLNRILITLKNASEKTSIVKENKTATQDLLIRKLNPVCTSSECSINAVPPIVSSAALRYIALLPTQIEDW